MKSAFSLFKIAEHILGEGVIEAFRPHIKRDTTICIFCYHKSGTLLFSNVFSEICFYKNWRFKRLLGKQGSIPEKYDIIQYAHSLIDISDIEDNFVGVHVVRDPRDIIVSGYLYHRRGGEGWCINDDFSTEEPIGYPQVPHSQKHRSREWKKKYLSSLNGMSYQDNLLERSVSEGIKFEMEKYGKWTIDSMTEWDYEAENIKEVKLENVILNFDDKFDKIFRFLGFEDSDRRDAVDVARRHDLQRMESEKVEEMNHVSSNKLKKWEEYFSDDHKRMFKDKFGDVLVELGYEENQEW